MVYTYEEAMDGSLTFFDGNKLASRVFVDKYSLKDEEGKILEKTPDDMHHRIAEEIARIERKKFASPFNHQTIFSYLERFKKIIPQGGILFGVGNPYQYTSLANCWSLDCYDSYSSICQTDQRLVNITKRRGGVGINLSRLRPNGARTQNAAGSSTGPIAFGRRFANSLAEVGQCISKGEQVLTKRGLVNIENIIPNRDCVWTKEGWVKVLRVFQNGKKQIYQIKSKMGFTIKTSLSHRFLSIVNDKPQPVPLQQLNVGDVIAIIPGISINYNTTLKLQNKPYEKSPYNKSNRLNAAITLPTIIDKDFAYFLGYSYGDGFVGQQKNGKNIEISVSIGNNYSNIKNKIIRILQEKIKRPFVRSGDGNCTVIGIRSRILLEWLEYNQILKQKSANILFPKIIEQSSPNIQLAFLSGYFDADGDINKKGGYRFTSTSLQFIQSCQKILIANNIIAKIHIETPLNPKWKTKYRLCITGPLNQKNTKATFACSCKIQTHPSIHGRFDYMQTIFKPKDFSIKHNRHNYCSDNSKYMSLNVFNRLKNEGVKLPYPIVKDTILKIEHYGEEETFDLELEKEHLFWCNGFYVHNSGRRGAGLLSMNIHHPDISNFIHMKEDTTQCTTVNISVQITNEFLQAVKEGKEYEQRWPVDSPSPSISQKVDAGKVWRDIIKCAWNTGDPGLLLWDTILKESIPDCYGGKWRSISTNPCGELVLCDLGSCLLTCINTFSYVENAFSSKNKFNFLLFYQDVQIAQRISDDIIDLEIERVNRILSKIKQDPEPEDVKREETLLWKKAKEIYQEGRRTGLGLMGIADTLAALNISYASKKSLKFLDRLYKTLKFGSYRSSVDMAKELGTFPIWDWDKEKENPFLKRIKGESLQINGDLIEGYDLYHDMGEFGRRNIACITSSPTGTVSIEAQVSSGMEPIQFLSIKRKLKLTEEMEDHNEDEVETDVDGNRFANFVMEHPKLKEWREVTGKENPKESPWHGCCAHDIDPFAKLKLQSIIQQHIDHSISNTLNLPKNASQKLVGEVFEAAYDLGLKGITVYRDGSRKGIITDSQKEVDKVRNEDIIKTEPPSRPRELPCDVHHLNVRGQKYYVLVGLYGKNRDPYEIFCGANNILADEIKSGIIIRKRKGYYKAVFEEHDTELSPVMPAASELEEAVTRLSSVALRHGADIYYLVKQLERVGEKRVLQDFCKAMSRTLKKYIKEDRVEEGEKCSQCGNESLIRKGGCPYCLVCGHSSCL